MLADCAVALEAASSAVSRLQGLSEQTPSGFNINPWVLFRPLRLREARLSSRIEDTVASSQDIALAAIERLEREEPLEVQNYLAAAEIGAGQPRPMTEADLRALHQRLLQGLADARRKHPGQYRPDQVYIGDRSLGFGRARFVPPPAIEVPRLMTELIGYMDHPPVDLPKLVVAGVCHYQFETIHPFMDGNGRLGRMLITQSICRFGLLKSPLVYPSAAIDRSKQRYYDTLNAVSLRGDWFGWISYFLDVVRESAEDALRMTGRLLNMREGILEKLSDRSLSQRIVSAVDFLFEQPVFTPAMLHERIGGTTQTARNYIATLEEKGVLARLDDRVKNPRYYAPEIIRLSDED
ncbi:MAG: Fic family protein [Phycisphaerales bacterium]